MVALGRRNAGELSRQPRRRVVHLHRRDGDTSGRDVDGLRILQQSGRSSATEQSHRVAHRDGHSVGRTRLQIHTRPKEERIGGRVPPSLAHQRCSIAHLRRQVRRARAASSIERNQGRHQIAAAAACDDPRSHDSVCQRVEARSPRPSVAYCRREYQRVSVTWARAVETTVDELQTDDRGGAIEEATVGGVKEGVVVKADHVHGKRVSEVDHHHH
mmetsp:Transcript_52464/g.137371  ORF Transcript_52464/g.137371 Transcript_52464/m.137371 type:complete len:215 (+) Transcript_52464:4089-4733(+)